MLLKQEKLHTIDLEKMREKWEIQKKLTGPRLRKALLKNEIARERSVKTDLKWMRARLRQICRLKRRNPEFIQMDCAFDMEGSAHWVDVMLKLPRIFRWQWHWITTFSSHKLWKEDESGARELRFQSEACEFGSEYPIKDPDDNLGKFNETYYDTVFTKDNILHYYEKWVKIFMPQFTGRIKVGTYYGESR